MREAETARMHDIASREGQLSSVELDRTCDKQLDGC